MLCNVEFNISYIFVTLLMYLLYKAGSIEGFTSRSVKYYVADSNIDPQFKQQTENILQNSNWKTYRSFQQADSEQDANVVIRLVSDKELDWLHSEPKYYPDGKQVRFSYTVQSSDMSPEIYINSKNWLYGVKESGLSLDEYRTYVINHEFGHALGYHHQPCNTGRCPVMYQSTRGCPEGTVCGFQPNNADLNKKIKNRYFD